MTLREKSPAEDGIHVVAFGFSFELVLTGDWNGRDKRTKRSSQCRTCLVKRAGGYLKFRLIITEEPKTELGGYMESTLVDVTLSFSHLHDYNLEMMSITSHS